MIERTARQFWQKFCEDSLFRNSLYLMASTAVMGVLGFAFWGICSRLYSPHDVGLATTLISASTLLTIMSLLGFNNVIVRFLAKWQGGQERLISTAAILSAVACLLTSAGFMLWAIVSHNAIATASNVMAVGIVFATFVLITTADTLLDSVFIAHRATKYVLVKNTVMSLLKVCLPFVAVRFGFIGIVGAFALALAIPYVGGVVFLQKKYHYHFRPIIDQAAIRKVRRYALGNYAGNVAGILPPAFLPLIVASSLGPQAAAFFYMPMMIATLLNVIPNATAQSLFAEASHDEGNMNTYILSAFKHLFVLLVPAALFVFVFGGYILQFFGPEYAQNGTAALRILALSSLVGAANYLGDTLLNIKKYVKLYVFMNAINAFTIVILSYIFADKGLAAVAWANLVGQSVTLVIYGVINYKLIVGLGRQPTIT